MAGALHGLRVIDCTHVLAGAYCSMLLADLGADVIKIEPLAGEITRGQPGSAFRPFDFVNRNKRAISVDITRPEGAEIVGRLAGRADIFVENYRPGTLEKQGLGYDALSRINPGLIYASISGFGQDGPYRDRGGFDLVTQAMSGVMSFTGERGSEEPVAAGVPLSDLNAGVFAALGVCAALNHRSRTGEGQYLETSLLEAVMAYTMWETGMALTLDVDATRAGTRHRLAAPYEALRTADGWLVVGVNNQKLWRRFCEALGAVDLAIEEAFATPSARIANRDRLQSRIEEILARDTTANWVVAINAKGVPCGPINTMRQALADPQVVARGFIAEVGDRKYPRTPLSMARSPIELRTGAPKVGEHTGQLLEEAGYTRELVAGLVERKVVAI